MKMAQQKVACTFVQPHEISTVGETIFVTDAATGNVKLITELSDTTQFLKHLGLLYESFGITCINCCPAYNTAANDKERE